MEPRRALEILRRQSGCDGAGCQRAAACSQPARPAGDPVGIGQFDALDVVAIRVEHGAGPPACRLPVPGLGQPGHTQAVEVPGGCPGVIDVSVLPSVPVTIARAWFRQGQRDLPPRSAGADDWRPHARNAECGNQGTGEGSADTRWRARPYSRDDQPGVRGLASTRFRARVGRQMRRAHPGALPCAGLPAVIVSSAVSPKPSQLIRRLYAARVRRSAARSLVRRGRSLLA